MDRQKLKVYGLTRDEIIKRVEPVLAGGDISFEVKERFLDALITIEGSGQQFANALSMVVRELSAYIYAEEDISVYDRLFECLSVKRKSLCLLEQATGGIITAALMQNEGAEEIIKTSYVLTSINDLIRNFDLKPFKFTSNHGVCGEIAFDIASYMRTRIDANLYIVCLSTLAEGNELYYNKEHRAYIAIGAERDVALFEIAAGGKKRKDFMNQVARSICFKLIKLLK